LLPPSGYNGQVKFRFVTDTYTGAEVIHCHYLNHEDIGCITYFDIVAP
jgi:FtsP/CotA-like multicopper oxidase with cupredoxin domain